MMRHHDVIYLTRTIVTGEDDYAQTITETTERLVFANEMSVSVSEFYAAGNSGMKPEKQFEIHSFEYEGESSLRHNDIDYKIVRTTGQGDKLRIICERMIGHGSNRSNG